MNEQQIKEQEQREQQWKQQGINERALKCGMTYRIKTLALQAGMMLDSNDLMPGLTLMLWDNDIQKFAELIVRECAKIVEDNMDPQSACFTPAFIKEHFGVVE